MTEICNFQGTTLVTIRVVGESSRAPKKSLPWKRVAGGDILEQIFGLVFSAAVQGFDIQGRTGRLAKECPGTDGEDR
jgi:hypothetical protein